MTVMMSLCKVTTALSLDAESLDAESNFDFITDNES